MIKVVVFDLDGVIANSKELYVNVIYNVLKKYGFGFTKKQITAALGPRLVHTLKNLRFFPKVIFKKLSNEVHGTVAKKAAGLKICPYSKDALKRLKKRRMKVVLLTNSHKGYIKWFFGKHNLGKYFNATYGGDEFVSKKEGLKMIFKKYKVKPREVLYVGDRIIDFEAAKAVKCNPAIVSLCSWDKSSLKNRKYNNYLINDLRKLDKLISSIE